MWSEVVSFNKRYPSKTEYTYTDFFLHNVGIGVFFSDYHYPRGFSEKLFYYIGCKTRWLKRYKTECDISMKNARMALEYAFEPQLKSLLKQKLEDGNYVQYYDDGKIKEEQTYKNGKKNGRHISYNHNGNIWMVETYKNGKRNGKYLITKLLKGEK